MEGKGKRSMDARWKISKRVITVPMVCMIDSLNYQSSLGCLGSLEDKKTLWKIYYFQNLKCPMCSNLSSCSD